MFNPNYIFQPGLLSDENDSPEFLPLLSQEEEDEMNKEVMPDILPILPLRNTVLFPGVVFLITVGRDKSIRLIRDAHKSNKIIGVVAQKDPNVDDPQFSDLYSIGTQAQIIKMLRMPDGNTTVIIQGKKRFQLGECVSDEPYFQAKVIPYIEDKPEITEELTALISSIKDSSLRIIDISPNIPSGSSFCH